MGYPSRPVPPPPPRIDPAAVRPRRFWYAVAGLFALLGLIGAAVLFVYAFQTPQRLEKYDIATLTVFDAGTPATVQLTAAKRWGIYFQRPAVDPSASGPTPSGPTPSGSTSSPSAPPLLARCTATALDGGTVDLAPTSYTSTYSEAGITWQLMYEVTVSQDGRYQVSCEPTDPAAAGRRYSVAEQVDIGGVLGTFLTGFGAIFGVFLAPCIGLLIAAVIALITLIRRYNHRQRLLHRVDRPL